MVILASALRVEAADGGLGIVSDEIDVLVHVTPRDAVFELIGDDVFSVLPAVAAMSLVYFLCGDGKLAACPIIKRECVL